MSQPIALSFCVLALSGTLATCQDEQSAARREAAEQVASTSERFERASRILALPGGEAFDQRRTELTGVLRDAKAIPSAEGGPEGAKGLLIASVQRELAAMDLAEAGVTERALGRERRVIHTLLDAGQLLAAIAEGRRAVDVTDARTRLDNLRESAVELDLAATAAVDELEQPINELTGQIEADRSEIERLEDQANQLRGEFTELGPARGFSRFEQAVALEREADRHEYAIARREIDLDYELRPELRLAQRQIEESQAMLESIGRSEGSLDEFLRQMEQDADVTSEQVRRLGGAIAERIGELETVVAGGEESMAVLYGAAAERLEDAARQAAGAVRNLEGNDAAAARLAAARAEAQLGRLRWSQVAGLTEHRTLLERLAGADDVLAADQYRGRLEEVATTLQQTRDQVEQAYTASQSSLGQVSFRGREAGDANLALGAFKSAVDEAIASITGTTAPPAAEAGGAAPGGGARATADDGDATADVSGRGTMSPEALLQRLQQLSNTKQDIETFLALCYTSSPQARSLLDASSAMASSMEQIQDAFEAQYGVRMEGQAAGSTSLVPTLGEASLETRADDTAICTFTNAMGQQDQMTFRRVDGRWYIEADDLVKAGGMVSPDQVRAMTEAMQQLADELAPQIRRGALGSMQAAQQTITQRLMQAMMSAMGQGPGS